MKLKAKIKAAVCSALALLFISVAVDAPQAFIRGSFLSAGGGGSGPTANTWNTYPVGAGGFETGFSVANDGTMVIRTDTGGFYQWNASATAPNGTLGVWQQGVLSTTMPPVYAAFGQGFYQGVYEVQVCASNSSHIYLTYPWQDAQQSTIKGSVFKSSNKGASFAVTGFLTSAGSVPNDVNFEQNGGPKNQQGKIAVDPNSANCQRAFAGTGNAGLWFTNDSAATWTQVSTGQVPLATTGMTSGPCSPCHPGYLIAIDPNSNTAGISQTVIVQSWGNGIYKSTNGGTIYTSISSGGPTNGISQGYFDPTTHDFFAVEVASGGSTGINLWRYSGSTWRLLLCQSSTAPCTGALSGTSVQAVAVDVSNSQHIIAVSTAGQLNETANSNTTAPTWSGWTGGAVGSTLLFSGTGDVTWLTTAALTQFGAGINVAYINPLNSHQIFAPGGQNFWTTTWAGSLTANQTITWSSMSRGIEDLVGIDITIPAGAPQATYNGSSIAANTSVASAWDFGTFYKPSLTSYATTNASVVNGPSAAWDVEYCGSGTPGSVVNYVDGSYAGGSDYWNLSGNFGSSWSSLTIPAPALGTNGYVACSTPTNFIMASRNAPYYTTNGSSFTALTSSQIPGQTSWSGWGEPGTGQSSGARFVTADRVNANQFTMLINGGNTGGNGMATTTNSGANWIFSSFGGVGFGTGREIKAVPGQANHVWYAAGYQLWQTTSLQYTTNANCGTTNCMTWNTVSNVSQAYGIAFGKSSSTACSGACSYPAIYMTGFVTASSATTVSGAGNVTLTLTGATGNSYNAGAAVTIEASGPKKLYGTVVSSSGVCGASCALSVNLQGYAAGTSGSASSWVVTVYGTFRSNINSPSTSPPWVQLGDSMPLGIFDSILGMNADPDNYGWIYMAYGAIGYVYGYFP